MSEPATSEEFWTFDPETATMRQIQPGDAYDCETEVWRHTHTGYRPHASDKRDLQSENYVCYNAPIEREYAKVGSFLAEGTGDSREDGKRMVIVRDVVSPLSCKGSRQPFASFRQLR